MDVPDYAALVVDQAPDLIAVYDLYGNLLYRNPAHASFFPDAEGTNIYDMLSDRSAAQARLNHAMALEAAERGLFVQNIIEFPDGTPTPMEATVRMTSAGDAGQPLFVVIARPSAWHPSARVRADNNEQDDFLAEALAHGA